MEPTRTSKRNKRKPAKFGSPTTKPAVSSTSNKNKKATLVVAAEPVQHALQLIVHGDIDVQSIKIKYGKDVIAVRAGGDCFFLSISVAIFYVLGWHVYLRKLTCAHILLHPEMFSEYITGCAGGPRQRVANYLEGVLPVGKWVGPLEAKALSDMLQVCVVTLNTSGDLINDAAYNQENVNDGHATVHVVLTGSKGTVEEGKGSEVSKNFEVNGDEHYSSCVDQDSNITQNSVKNTICGSYIGDECDGVPLYVDSVDYLDKLVTEIIGLINGQDINEDTINIESKMKELKNLFNKGISTLNELRSSGTTPNTTTTTVNITESPSTTGDGPCIIAAGAETITRCEVENLKLQRLRVGDKVNYIDQTVSAALCGDVRVSVLLFRYLLYLISFVTRVHMLISYLKTKLIIYVYTPSSCFILLLHVTVGNSTGNIKRPLWTGNTYSIGRRIYPQINLMCKYNYVVKYNK